MGLICRNLLKTHITKMPASRLSTIFMKTHELDSNLHDVNENKWLIECARFGGSNSPNSHVALRQGGEILGNEQWSGYEKAHSQKTTDVNVDPAPLAMRLWREATVVKTLKKISSEYVDDKRGVIDISRDAQELSTY